MNNVKLLTVFAENKTGQLARVTGILAEAGVNIRWVTIAGAESFGVVKVLVDNCELAHLKLKQQGLPVSLVEVLAIEVEDKPGGLFTVASCLGQNGINVENASGFVSSNRAVLLIEVADVEAASEALQKAGLRLLSEAETLRLASPQGQA